MNASDGTTTPGEWNQFFFQASLASLFVLVAADLSAFVSVHTGHHLPVPTNPKAVAAAILSMAGTLVGVQMILRAGLWQRGFRWISLAVGCAGVCYSLVLLGDLYQLSLWRHELGGETLIPEALSHPWFWVAVAGLWSATVFLALMLICKRKAPRIGMVGVATVLALAMMLGGMIRFWYALSGTYCYWLPKPTPAISMWLDLSVVYAAVLAAAAVVEAVRNRGGQSSYGEDAGGHGPVAGEE